jgi:hypothetical protein
VGARIVHPLGVVPEAAVECLHWRGSCRMFSSPVGARIVHPLGVVPETTVDRVRLTVVLRTRAQTPLPLDMSSEFLTRKNDVHKT